MEYKSRISMRSVLTNNMRNMIFNCRKNTNNYPEISAYDLIKYRHDTVMSMLYIYKEDGLDEFYNDFIKIFNDLEEKIIGRIPFHHYLKPLHDHYKDGKYYVRETKIIVNGFNEIFDNIKIIDGEKHITIFTAFEDREYRYNIDKNIFYSIYPNGEGYVEKENLLYNYVFFNYERVLII